VSEEPGAPLLAARGIVKHYGARAALRGVDVDARAGELVAVIGPNGAGKTTLLSILAGVQRASAGTVTRASAAPGDGSSIGWGVGWVPQQPAVYSRLTVAENLDLFARLQRVADPRGAVATMLTQTGLRERAGERLDRLSGGNRQRVNIALGLLADPAILVLDEPSSSLDPRQRERLWRFILGLSGHGRCVVFSTHNVAEAERYATRVVVLADGELLFDGAPAELVRAGSAGPGRSGARSASVPAGTDAVPDERGLDFEAAFVEFLRERGH
jgi:ABC-2 type transport system ATP-binding protein